jgi:anti-anti-sigma factor
VDASVVGRHERRRIDEPLPPLRGPLLTVSHRRESDVEVFAGHGEIDISTATLLCDALRPTVQEGSGNVVVDLSEITLDSTGAHLLLTTFKQLAAQHRRLTVACQEASTVHRVLSLTGMLGILPVHRSGHSARVGGDELLTDPTGARARWL